MSHYSYHGSTPNMHSSQPQQLTPISNIATHPYQQGSPGPSQILPPLQTAPNGPGPYGHDAYGNDASGSRSGDQNSLPHLTGGQAHMNIAEPQTSYGPIQPPYTSAPQPASFGAASRYSNAPHDGPFGTYSQNTMNHHNDMFQGFYERANGLQNGIQGYQDPTQMQNVQQNQQQQEQSQRPGGHSEARVMPVVGSQGRRGILPSAAGPPPPPGSGPGTPRSTGAPNRNAENKYPCYYCNKTYLHLKHLKRHHLRHTGERPYQCNLCYETFCRSDILKRHFTKCSLRRGNPTGASHLTNAQAHLTRPGPSASTSTANNSQSLPPANDGPAPNSSYQSVFSASSSSFHWSGGDPPQISRSNGDSGRSTRSNSAFDRPESGSGDDRRRYSATNSLAPINGNMNATGQASNGGPHPRGRHSINGIQEPQVNGHASRDAYGQPMPPSTSAQQQHQHQQHMGMAGHADQQHSHYMRGAFPPGGHMQQGDWSNYFQPGGQDTMMFSTHH